MIRTVTATRYVKPLREGGSLPAIIEADDDGMYVLKFRGAAQGPKALIAELLAGRIGRALGLPVPELVFVEFDGALGRNEPHAEIQELVARSEGLNVALDYLPGSFNFDPLNVPGVEPDLAARIVWFDAYITNVDRTPRNPNMLLWHRKLWLIDHGAALYMHHTWADWRARARGRFQPIKDHILLKVAGDLQAADAALAPLVTPALIAGLVADIPEAWLEGEPAFASVGEHRAAYEEYLRARVESPRLFVEEAADARAQRL
ncbi:aminotransferase class I and II [Oscillochloris sp. ZM17-4]|uniref:HipA family kinase n=1 Tax=Oscillochloris sp. ZM17-4 TaxID=2866714 RepID=UPI001C73259F|nr:HipA family kinase [Oscillochloris sp. ZM17-4]MBX0329377.1 aminotransferase class I and II [Oscillochloris sp. ZM17-4]